MLLEERNFSKSDSSASSDVDLSDIFIFVLGGVKKGLKSILIALAIGAALGLAYYFFSKPVYSSQMMGYSETLKKEVIFNLVEDLQKLIDQKDYDQLQSFLNLSEKSVKSIVQLKASAGIERTIYDTEESNIFVIEAKVDDINIYDSLSSAIGYYVDNNEYVKIRQDRQRVSIKNSIARMKIEIYDLEELKVNMREALSKNTYRTNLFLSDIGYSSSKIVELYERENTLLNKLDLLQDIKVLRDFVKFKKKKEPKLITTVITFQLLAVFVVFAFWIFGRLRATWKQLD